MEERRPFDLVYSVLKNDRARLALQWQPTYSLQMGLEKYLGAR